MFTEQTAVPQKKIWGSYGLKVLEIYSLCFLWDWVFSYSLGSFFFFSDLLFQEEVGKGERLKGSGVWEGVEMGVDNHNKKGNGFAESPFPEARSPHGYWIQGDLVVIFHSNYSGNSEMKIKKAINTLLEITRAGYLWERTPMRRHPSPGLIWQLLFVLILYGARIHHNI